MDPSIWTGMYGEFSLPEALRILSDCGWRRFEISSEHLVSIEKSNDPDSLIEKAQACICAHGLSTPQAHALLDANVASADPKRRAQDVRRLLHHIEIAARFSVKTLVIHPGGYDPPLDTGRDDIPGFNVAAFRILGDAAAKHGIRIGLENLPSPGVSTAREMISLLQLIDHPAIGVTLDTSHANMCSLSSARMVRELGEHLIATHISDNDGSGDQHLTPGGGTIDWVGLMKAFRNIGYEGIINLEIPGERHEIPEFRRLKTRFALEVAECLVGL